MCGSEASAPAMASCVGPFMPSGAQTEPVATITCSAPYSTTSEVDSRLDPTNCTLSSLPIWVSRQSTTRRQALKPGISDTQLTWPPMRLWSSTTWTAS